MTTSSHLAVAAALAAIVAAMTGAPRAAAAAGETCNGQAATIVGTPGGTVTGTAGPDVIVTNGAVHVNAGAGDDVICTTGTVGTDSFTIGVGVLAGDGNDLVDRRADMGPLAVGFADLGAGDNAFHGSAVKDQVSSKAGASDAIDTGDGADAVFVSYTAAVSSEVDSVDLGTGDDDFSLSEGLSTGLTVTGGPGSDTFTLNERPTRLVTLDDAAGQARCALPPATTSSS